MGVVQVIIDQSANIEHTGIHEWNRALGGVIIPPSGTSFPVSPIAGEYFFRTDEGKAYRRNDANTTWEIQIAQAAAHTHPGSEITSQVSDSAALQGHSASYFSVSTHGHAHSELTGVTANQHHNQAHAIDGADHTGQLAHSSLSGITATDHHSNANDPTANQKAALNNAPNALTSLNPVADKSYVDSLAQGLGWLTPVADRIFTPPGSPTTGDRYLIYGGTPTGDWVGHAGEIAEWDGSAWDFTVPIDRTTVTVQDEDQPYTQTASTSPWVWVASGGATAIHGNEKHSPTMLTVGSNRSDANLDILTDGDQDDDVDALHLHVRRDKSRVYFWDDFIGLNYENRIWSITGGAAASQALIGGVLRIRANSGATSEFSHGDRCAWSVSKKFDFICRGYMSPGSGAGASVEIGLLPAASTTDWIAWLYRRGTTNFLLNSSAGSVVTEVDSGVAADSNYHVFRIKVNSSGNLEFYLDGVLRGTITTNIPTGDLQPYFYCVGVGSASDFYADYVEIVGER